MKNYIVLFPETFLWFDKSEGVFDNSKEQKVFRFHCNDLICSFCMAFHDPINLYAAEIENANKKNASFSSWIDCIVNHKIGAIYSIEDDAWKPFSFPPILNLRGEIEESQINKSRYYSSVNIAECLSEMSFFLIGGGLSKEEQDYYKQIIYPCNQQFILGLERICSFLENSNITHLRQVNLICSDQLIYPGFKNLIGLLVKLGVSVTCYMQGRYTDPFVQIVEKLENTDFVLKLYFSTREDFIRIQSYVKEGNIQCNWIFLIKNEDDFYLCEDLIKQYSLTQTDIFPVLTNSNLDFFRDNIFISLDNIENISLTKQNIFCNQVLNSNYWGHLFILPDGYVYGNLNKKPLGTVQEDAMELIRREINAPDSSWKCTREKVMPCQKCIYRNLCPPPSNYEFYLNKFNLCVINE